MAQKTKFKILPTLLVIVGLVTVWFFVVPSTNNGHHKQRIVEVGVTFSPPPARVIIVALIIGDVGAVYETVDSPWVKTFPVRDGVTVQVSAKDNPGEMSCYIKVNGDMLMEPVRASSDKGQTRVDCMKVVP